MGTAYPPNYSNEAKCIIEPRGEHGLEGYSLGELYKFEFREIGAKDGKPYYRIWPTDGDYYETCSVQTFKRYFQPKN